ncbi:MAG: hypothetical protein KDC93_15305 [Cyclobacteriaceae bacterium]|nr:hypothetical protein [Cyclobacteriaceae bacterium]
MRPLLIIIGISLGITSGIAQCNQYYQLSEGSEWEMESYNAKGKLTGKQTQKVTSYSGGANSFAATVQSTVYDKKDKEVMKGDLEFKCNNGTMMVDMRNFINEEQMKAFQNYEMQIEADNLEVPNDLSVGQTLKDGSVTLTTSNSPIPMNMSVNITDRKVVAKESITTPAGTFECYKITSKSTVNTKMGIGMTFNFSTVEWLAPKVAVVKSESYRNDKLQGYTLLTKRN